QVTMPLSALHDAEVKAALSQYFPNLDYANGSSNPARGNIFADFAVYYPMIMPIPSYVYILIVRFKILRVLRRAGSQISERTKELHMQLVRTLTYHACLPIFTLIADVIFTMLLMDVYRHPLMENFFASVPSCLSPLLTLALIRPYRS
ncbi:hypothetical protein PMAYCL1PPCAC_21653, partial [Pristionchus mayeri]